MGHIHGNVVNPLVVTLLNQSDSSLPWKLSIVNSSSARAPEPLLHARLLADLVLYKSYADKHGCFKLTCKAIISCPELTASLQSSLTSGSYSVSFVSSIMVPEPWEKRCDRDISFVAQHSPNTLSHPNQLTVILCITHCLLHNFPEVWKLYLSWGIEIWL